VVVDHRADPGDEIGDLAQPLADCGEVTGLAFVEPLDALAVRGELVERGSRPGGRRCGRW
jgi:hypothetical protein